jgi:hypothetical protein
MPQPYDYSLNVPSPFAAFTQGMQVGQAGRANEQAIAQQQREAERATRLQTVIGSLGPDATYADYMAQVRANPDLAEVLLGQQQQFNDARRNALFNAGSQAFATLRPGLDGSINPEQAIAALEQNAAAFENSGETDVARQLRDSAQGIRANPAAARAVLGTMLAFSDPDRFRTISQALGGEQELTTFQKDLMAAGIDPASDTGRNLARQYAEGRADPIVEMTTPDGTGIFRGPFSEYRRLYGNVNAIVGDTSIPSGSPLQPPVARSPQIRPRSERPNMTDAELISWGNRAAREGTNVELIFRQLREWGVNP